MPGEPVPGEPVPARMSATSPAPPSRPTSDPAAAVGRDPGGGPGAVAVEPSVTTRAGERLVRAEWTRLAARFPVLARTRLRVNPRLRSTLGRALRGGRGGPDAVVEVARWLLVEGDTRAIVDTTRHEAAHVLAAHEDPTTTPHGPVWRRWARRLGARPERLCRDPALAARSPTARLGPKWDLTCRACSRRVGLRFRLDRDWLPRVRSGCCSASVDAAALR